MSDHESEVASTPHDEVPGPSDAVLAVTGLCVEYGRARAVSELSITLYRGQHMALVGANGAGKTATLNGIAGLVRVASGTITLGGRPIHSLSAWRRARRGLILVPEARHLFGDLTVQENLAVGSGRVDRAIRRGRIDDVFTTFPRLAQSRNRIVNTLSGGEQQMLAVGRGICAAPAVLMLDEPSIALSPKAIEDVAQALVRASELYHFTMLISAQELALVRGLCTTVNIMKLGRSVASGPVDEVLTDEFVHQAFLGDA